MSMLMGGVGQQYDFVVHRGGGDNKNLGSTFGYRPSCNCVFVNLVIKLLSEPVKRFSYRQIPG